MKPNFTKIIAAIISIFLLTAFSATAETITSSQDGNWKDASTWVNGIVPTSTDSVVVQHQVEIYTEDSCMHLYVAPSGTLQNKSSATRTLAVMGNLTVDGTATNTNYDLNIHLGGDLHLNGIWSNVKVYFIGSSEQVVSATPGKIFNTTYATKVFQDEDPSSPLKFTTDLTFNGIDLIGNASTLEFTPGIEVTFDGGPIRSMNIIGNNSTLTMQNGAFVEYSNLGNLSLDGLVTFGNDNASSGELINTGTMQNLASGYRTLTVNGNFTNNGAISISNYDFHLIFLGNVTNNGIWTSSDIFFDGTVDQHIVSSPGVFIYCDLLQDRDVSSKIVLDGDLEIHHGTIDLDYATMDANGHKITMRNEAFFQNSLINQAFLGGRFRCYTNCVFTGTTTIVDTLENRPVGNYFPVTFQGKLINNGIIRRSNAYAYDMFIHGDFEVNGPVDLEDLTFAGVNDQTVYSTSKGGVLDIDQVYDTVASSAVIFNADMTFIGSNFDLDGATINLNNGALIMQGGNLRNGSLTANNQYLHQSGGAAIWNMHFSNVELRGICQLYDNNSFFSDVTNTDTLRNHPSYNNHPELSTDGTFANDGTINRSDAYGIKLYVHNDFINNGPVDMEDLVFAGVTDQTIYSTSKGGVIDVDQVSDTSSGSAIIFNSDMTFFESSWDLNGATINLNDGSLIMQGGNLGYGFLTSNNQYLRQSANAKISGMHFTNVELRGICKIGTQDNYFTNVTVTDTLMNHPAWNHFPKLFVDGDFVNNGVITNSDNYWIDLRVDGNYYNNGKANYDQIVFTGDDIQHFYSPIYPISDSDIKSTKAGGLVQCDDEVLLTACTVDFSGDVFSLQNGDLNVTGGILQNVGIEGNGFKVVSDGNGGTGNVAFEDLSIEGHLYLGGSNISFDNVTITGTISQRPSYNNDTHITTTGDFINNGHIIDNDVYKLWFYVQDVVINNGEWVSERLVFDGDDMHHIESLGANPFEVDDITISTKGGEVSITNELYLLNTDVNLSGQNLYIPDAGILDLDNSAIQNTMVNGGEFSTISSANNSWLSASVFNNVIISGEVDTRTCTYADCVLEAAMQNDNVSPDAVIDLEGNFTNNGSLINRPSYAYELFSNVLGHVYNYGIWEIEKSNWKGVLDQDIYLMDGSEINTPSEFYAMLGTGSYQWYKNDEEIVGETTNTLDFTAITVGERGYYHCETGEGPSRTIRICTPVEIDLAAEAWFCQYETVTLEPEITFGEPPYTWSWSPATGLSDPNVQSPQANPDEPTLYTLLVTDAIGCNGQIDIMVQQYPQLFASAGSDKEICLGESTVLNGSASGGVAEYSYQWTPVTGLNNPNIATPVASPVINTTYTLTVTDQNGCSETDAVNVIVNPLPEVFGLSQDSTHFCYEQDTIIVWLLDSEIGVNYHLLVNGMPNPGGEVFAGTGEAIPVWATTTVQGHYTLKGVNAVTGCENMMEGSVMIFIDFLPEVVDQSGDETVIEGESTTLWVEVTSTQPPWLQWYKDGEMLEGETNHQMIIDGATLDDTGEYWCVVANNCDVTQSDPVTILVLEQQMVDIPAGWSGFSTYLDLHDPELPAMFEELGDDLVIVNDFDNMYWPDGGVNTYLNWVAQRGAQIKLEESATLDLRGIQTMDQNLILGPGWHYLPVLSNCQVNAQDLFSPLGDAVELVKDIAGTGLYWPEYDIYTLTNLEPGQAYFLKLNQEVSITFPECTKYSGIAPSPLKPGNTSPWPDPAYTPGSHIIAVPDMASNEAMQPGDWVGVFNSGGVCSGLARYEGNQMAISVFEADPTGNAMDGFGEGEQMHFRVFREASGEILDFTPRFAAGSDGADFKVNGISVVEGLSDMGSSANGVNVYPNPATDYLHVNGIALGSAWKLLNTTGVVVASGSLSADLRIDLTNIRTGVYTLQLAGSSTWNYQKVIVK